jgi:DNA-binding NarL/FixJ family response regulator
LLVDDSEIVRELVKATLEAAGYEVQTHGSPFGFSSSLMRQNPDLVLLDVNMPALSGDKLAEIAVKNRLAGGPGCPLLLFSDRPPHELARLAARCGANGYIHKTNDSEALIQAVNRYLQG